MIVIAKARGQDLNAFQSSCISFRTFLIGPSLLRKLSKSTEKTGKSGLPGNCIGPNQTGIPCQMTKNKMKN